MDTEVADLDYVTLTVMNRDLIGVEDAEIEEVIIGMARDRGLRDGPAHVRFDNAYFLDTGNFMPYARTAHVWAD